MSSGFQFKNAFSFFASIAVISLASSLTACTPVKDPNKVPVGNFITGASFSDTVPFDAGTDSKYVFDASKIELVGGVARLKQADQSDNSSTSFGSAVSSVGVAWGSNSLKLGNSGGCNATTTNCSEFNSTWTPGWANITGYWQLNGSGAITNGTTLTATIGPNGVASNTNTTGMTYATGKLQGGVTFDGVDDYLNCGTTLNPSGATSYSISAWVKSATGATDQGVAGWWDGTNGLFIQSAQSGQGFIFLGGDGSTYGTATYPIAGNWVHVVLVYDGTQAGNANRLKGYINGELSTLSFNTGTVPAAVPTLSSAQLRIGSVPTIGRFMAGSIDEVATFNRALNAGEIKHIYNRQSANFAGTLTSRILDSGNTSTDWTSLDWTTKLPTMKALPDYSGIVQNETSANYASLTSDTIMNGIQGLWHFDEAAGTSGAGSIKDSSGQNRNLTPTSATLGVVGKFQTSAQFNGTNTSFQVSPATAFHYDRTQPFTVAAWIYRGVFGVQHVMFENNDSSGLFAGWGFQILNDKLYFSLIQDNTSIKMLDAYSTSTIPAGQWTHVAVTYAGNSAFSGIKFYINGIQNTTVGNNSTLTGTVVGTSALQIGTWPGMSAYFKGSMDDAAIWSRELTSTEVSQIYARGASRLKFQVRSCNASNCSDGTWKGPDGTTNTYFSELFNMSTQAAIPSGRTLATLPSMLFSSFTSPPPVNRYFQYRAVLESDSATAAIQPELQSVVIGPNRYDTAQPTISTVTPISYRKLDNFTEALGAGGCAGGVRYTASFDGVNWLYWDGTQWTLSNGSYSQADPASSFKDGFGSLINVVSTNLYVRAHLNSSGSGPCELDQLSISGTR